ncbi:MAG: shikimate dehydrogenase [Anaerolineales bacterium]|nr:shikimate dehydrogenase [Anaerolineales bacterium]
MKPDFYSLGIIGFPLEHSVSPYLHKANLNVLGIRGNYRLYEVPPMPDGKERIVKILKRLRKKEIAGLNVTIPHKKTVIPFLDTLTSPAKDIGDVNTIYLNDGWLFGDNTDAPGFSSDLENVMKENGYQWKLDSSNNKHHALVIGAGGSACAVVYALARKGWRVTISARRLKQAQELAHRHLSGDSEAQISAITLDKSEINSLDLQISLIVNTTPIGLWPNIDDSPWPENLNLPKNAIVYDLVYNPSETKLVKGARAAGLIAVTGLGMLIEQAALAFERWTGIPANRDAMRNAVIDYI